MATTSTQKRESTLKLYQAVREDYAIWCAKTENGVQKFSQEYIIMKLAGKYFRAERTIENILYHRVGDKPKYIQTELF